MYALVLLAGSQQMSIAPVLPHYVHLFGLSGLEEGILIAASALATLAVSVPAGALCDRLGARNLTIIAGAAMAAAALLQGFTPSFEALVAARLLFGAGYGILWTAGLAWLTAASPDTPGLGATVIFGGAGGILGPVFIGFGAEYFGIAAPFTAIAVLIGLATLALVTVRLSKPVLSQPVPVLASLRTALGDRSTIAALAAVTVAGMSTAFATLLVPFVFHDAGGSAGAIGFAFSAAAVIFVVGSIVTERLGSRAVRVRTATAAVLLLVLVTWPATLSATPLAAVIMLLGTGAARAILWTVSYPLGARGAEQSATGVGVVMGLLNAVWAATAVVSPLLAGALVGPLGVRPPWASVKRRCSLCSAPPSPGCARVIGPTPSSLPGGAGASPATKASACCSLGHPPVKPWPQGLIYPRRNFWQHAPRPPDLCVRKVWGELGPLGGTLFFVW